MSTAIRSAAKVIFGTAVLVAALPVAASADPAGCGGLGEITLSSTGLMTGIGEASCSGSATRTYVVEIKQDKSGAPDPKVAGNSQQKTGTSYYVTVNACDGGKTATYYGRGYFTTNTTYHDSAHHYWHVC